MAPEALCDHLALLHAFPRGASPQAFKESTGHVQAAGGWAYKGLAPTTGSGSFLPQAATDWTGEVRGQERGCRQCRPLSSGRRGQWACSRGAGGGLRMMAGPSVLARGRIHTFEGKSLLAEGVLGSSYRHHGDPRPHSPLGSEQVQGSLAFNGGKITHPGPSPICPPQSSEKGTGPCEEVCGLQCGEGEGPGVCGGPLSGEEDISQSLEHGLGDSGHYTKASRLDEPLILRKSLSSSLFCCSCLCSRRR